MSEPLELAEPLAEREEFEHGSARAYVQRNNPTPEQTHGHHR
jgi:hypothetical protein